ncbi:MAG TPA: hypothetical protein VE667_03520 [Xanthobacteraceae bacterium]|nr:hypothetical protein [Xanthobacteraceae bacterium]
MRSGVIAQKMGMTRVFTEAGEHVPVTVLRLANCQVVAHRTKDKNGYVALQLGSGTRKPKNLTKATRGHFAAAKVEPKRKLAEFRVEEGDLIPVGAEITADHFVVGQFVDVTGQCTLPAGTEMIMPGDNATMDVELITPIAMEEKQRFAIREGGKTVGAGVVVSITE